MTMGRQSMNSRLARVISWLADLALFLFVLGFSWYWLFAWIAMWTEAALVPWDLVTLERHPMATRLTVERLRRGASASLSAP